MSRKLEIRIRMSEMQKEFSALNTELKELDDSEKRAAARDKYQEYKFKVGTYGHMIEPAEKVQDATDEDREDAGVGASGLVYTGFNTRSDYGYIMLRNKEEYVRACSVLVKLDAVSHLKDEKEKNKEKYIKILLGESDSESNQQS